MRLGEALARCPRLTLIAPDPAGTADSWERLLVRLESIGAAVEPEGPGLVFFDARGLLRLLGGIEGCWRRRVVRFAFPPGWAWRRRAFPRSRLHPGHGRAVRRSCPVQHNEKGRERARAYLAPLPVSLLRARAALADLPEALERLGVRTLGELAELPAAALADRFGKAGLLAYELVNGGDSALSPRPAREYLREVLELPEAASGMQLQRALDLLIDRLLARRERRGRTLRSVVISAVLVEQGGTWRDLANSLGAVAIQCGDRASHSTPGWS